MEVAVGVIATVAGMAGLDLTKNLSYFSIPAAWVCAHGPHLYSVIGTGTKVFDNRNPRTHRDRIAKSSSLTEEQKQFFSRVKSASDNGYETLGLFAAAVVAGNQAGLKPQTLNILSWGYIVTRLVYNFLYIKLGSQQKLTPLRSLVWSISVFISLGMFISAGLKMKQD